MSAYSEGREHELVRAAFVSNRLTEAPTALLQQRGSWSAPILQLQHRMAPSF